MLSSMDDDKVIRLRELLSRLREERRFLAKRILKVSLDIDRIQALLALEAQRKEKKKKPN